MAAKCEMCGKMSKSYLTTGRGDIVCGKTCYDAYLLELYLLRLEEDREANEQYNKKAYEQARELSAILSVYKHGNKDARKEAGKLIERWFK